MQQNPRQSDRYGTSHDLIEMLKSIGIEIDGVYKELLEKYERHILQEGRYPAPKKSDNLAKEFNSDNITEWPNTYVIDHDIRMIKAIINDLHNIIDSELRKE